MEILRQFVTLSTNRKLRTPNKLVPSCLDFRSSSISTIGSLQTWDESLSFESFSGKLNFNSSFPVRFDDIETHDFTFSRYSDREREVYSSLHLEGPSFGFPVIHQQVSNDKDVIINVGNLGDTLLDKLRCMYGLPIRMKTVFLFGIQMLNRLQTLHSKGYVHGNIAADNICFGRAGTSDENTVFLTNFQSARRIWKADGKTHIDSGDRQDAIHCCVVFASIAYHNGHELCRRDDLESLLYLLIFLLTRSLPWQYVKEHQNQYYDEIKHLKKYAYQLEVFDVFPNLRAYLDLVGNMKFEEEPDYDRLRRCLSETIETSCSCADEKLEWDMH